MAGEKLQSAMSGQVMPMRQLGFAIEETTLKQVALNHGITQSVENMTQAQKAQLRYIAIMEQAGNIGVLGDMARTIDTAANGMRVFTARLQQFARAVGNMVMPVLSAVLPYATAFVQVITEGAQKIAEFFGFELPKIDFSGASVSSGFDDITSSVDDATKANEKFKGSLSSIDQLNIIGSKDDGKNSAGNENQFDLGIELPEYDFLQGVESKTKQIAENIKAWFKEALPWIEAVGTAIAGVFIVSKINDFIGFLGKVKESISTIGGMISGKFGKSAKIFSGIAGGLAAGASSGILLNSGIKNLITGTGKLGGNIAKVASGAVIAGGAIALFIKLGNPLGAVITGIGAAIGIVSGYAQGLKELNEQLMNTIVYADNGGISIQGLTDGFSNYFSEISGHYDDILANTTAFKDNQDKLKNAATEIYNLTDKYIALDSEMTEEDANKLKSNLEIIAKGVTDSLGTGTQGIVDSLKTHFHDFATQLGVDVDDMVGKFYLLESMGNSAVAAIKKNADAFVGKIMSGENVAENMKSLQSEIQKMGVSDIGTKEAFSFNEALKQMSTAKIDFNDPDTFKKSLEDITSQYKSAQSAIDTAKTDQLYELESLRQRYSTMITETGITVKEAYDIAMDKKGAFDELFNTTRDTLSQAFDFDKTKLDIGLEAYMGAIDNQLENAQKQFASSKSGEASWENFWRGAGDSAKSLFTLQGINMDVEDDIYEGYMGDFKKKYSSFFDQISESTKGLNLEQGKEIGGYLIEGMANGALAKQEDLNRALDAAANGAIDEVKRICGVHSPSTVFAAIGGYLMQGMALGIDKDRHDVISSLDDTTKAMFSKMHRLSFNIPTFNTDNSAITMDMNTVYEKVRKENASFNNSYTLPRGAAAIGGAVGAAREAVSGAAQSAAANGGSSADININLQSYVELDGEQVGQAVSQYQQRQMAYSNGQ